jgi:hypothetical protein
MPLLGVQMAAASTPPPDVLIPNGVSNYALAAPKLFWHHGAVCNPTPQAVQQDGAEAAVQPAGAVDPETISRIATYGWTPRTLFSRHDAPGCNSYHIYSSIFADDQYVYWVDGSGLVRLSVEANPGDPPQLVTDQLKFLGGSIELAQSPDTIYALVNNPLTMGFFKIIAVTKSSGSSQALNTSFGQASDLSYDGRFVYFRVDHDLHRLAAPTWSDTIIAKGVSSYVPAGTPDLPDDRVYIAQGRQVNIFSNSGNSTSGSIYTGMVGSTIIALSINAAQLFLVEQQPGGCGFGCMAQVLIRTARFVVGSSSSSALYSTSDQHGISHLTNDGKALFWQEAGVLKRLAVNAEALLLTNMRITGILVTQGVQQRDNSVLLIQGRRTFVRVFVRSDGAAVPGVTAYLYGSWSGGDGGPLLPVNTGGATLTVQANPTQAAIDQSFLFELPWDWTTHGNLQLRAELNPFRMPIESVYTDNSISIAPLVFQPSPRLEVQLVEVGYTIDGEDYYPNETHIEAIESYMRRLYPLASSPGRGSWLANPTPGFRPIVQRINFGVLLGHYIKGKAGLFCVNHWGNLCGTFWTNLFLANLRTEQGLGEGTLMYGLLSSGPKDSEGKVLYPIRGQALTGYQIASGNAAAFGTAAHEIAHMLGRQHPFKGSALDTPPNNVCGNTADDGPIDFFYPYAKSRIGPGDGSIEGFDVGDPNRGIGPAVLPDSIWSDIISYCGPRWISDYTYKALYEAIPHDGLPLSAGETAKVAGGAAITGDWLSVFGAIDTGRSATFGRVRHLSSVASIPARTPGGYSIRLVDQASHTLVDYTFTPTPIHAHGANELMSFGQVVPFVAGGRQVQLVSLADGRVLASQPISARSPVIGDVRLAAAPTPVTGTVNLSWAASDPDGDPLSFDVLYSRDGGASFQPLQIGLMSASAAIDTLRLSGGQAIFRVIASDGVQTAQADSLLISMANKPPQPQIVTPNDTLHMHYGQLINFSGAAEDPQDGFVADARLVWTDQHGRQIGSGSLLSVADLPVGTNRITLTATNVAGLAASTSVTVIVDDDLRLPGSILSAGPAMIAWHIAPGTIQAQTMQLQIANAGGGTLDWTASTDTPWLTLSSNAGTAPSSITITANPAALASNRLHQASITLITAGATTPQTTTIPVSLAIGNVEDPPEQLAHSHIYLPFVRR